MMQKADKETALTRALLPRLRRRAARLLSDPAEAEDIVQEALMRLLEVHRKGKLNTPESYAMIILSNLARARWKERSRLGTLSEPVQSTPATGTARLVCGEIVSAIDRLPPEQAKLMRAVMNGETSPRQLADAAGLPVGTIMSRLARARGTLRREIGMTDKGSVSELL